MLHLNRFKSVNLYFVRLQQRERKEREGVGRERERMKGTICMLYYYMLVQRQGELTKPLGDQ